jgi:hypothetical protein
MVREAVPANAPAARYFSSVTTKPQDGSRMYVPTASQKQTWVCEREVEQLRFPLPACPHRPSIGKEIRWRPRELSKGIPKNRDQDPRLAREKDEDVPATR